MATLITIQDEQPLKGMTFRIREGEHGYCNKELWCRMDWKNDDWQLQFYDGRRCAQNNWLPMSELPGNMLPLIAKAIEHATELAATQKP